MIDLHIIDLDKAYDEVPRKLHVDLEKKQILCKYTVVW